VTRVSVMGTGSWGTTFAIVLADAGAKVTMWGRRPELCVEIEERHRNTDYLGDLELPGTISATPDAAVALDGADVVVLAVPSQTLRANLTAWLPFLSDGSILVSLMKGVEDGTMRRMSEVIAEVTSAGPDRIAVVSGPNLAVEIARRQPTATVVACTVQEVADQIAAVCSAAYFRPYTNTDVIGVELGGAVKNVIGLAVGIVEGMGLGDNSKASIITRGLAEISRLGVALGAEPATFAGLAGMGDLVATALPKPQLRGPSRPGHVPRRRGADHESDRGGREVVRSDPGAGPLARRRHADHRDGHRRRPRGPAALRNGPAPTLPRPQIRTRLTPSPSWP
jgi:glycerol-3-phosphate dehydrogenase (NAD(P)+)